MFQVTITGSSLSDLANNVSAMALAMAGNDAQAAAGGSGSSGSASTAAGASQAGKGSSQKDTGKASSAGQGAQAGSKSTGASAKNKEPELDYDADVKPLVLRVSKEKGRDVAVELLAEFTNPATGEPCTKGQEIDPSDWPVFIEKATEILNAEDIG